MGVRVSRDLRDGWDSWDDWEMWQIRSILRSRSRRGREPHAERVVPHSARRIRHNAFGTAHTSRFFHPCHKRLCGDSIDSQILRFQFLPDPPIGV